MINTTKFITRNDQFTQPRALEPTGIVVHSTGVNQRNVAPYFNGFNKSGIKKSVHGFLGMEAGALTFVQTLPYKVRCAGCGSGKRGSYNATHIQFEICEDTTSREWTDATYEAALDVCAELCQKYGIDPDNVVCHSEAYAKGYATNHADVMHWWPKYGHSMDAFRRELKERIEMQTRYKTIAEVPAALRKETQELIDAGALQGSGNGLDVTEDMLRSMIVMKRYIDSNGR